MARGQTESLPISFEKGLLESQSPSMLPNGFCPTLENWVPEPNGALRARRGWMNGSTTSAPATRKARGIGFFSLDNQTGDVKVKVGSFAKDTGAAPDPQSVTGVGFQPKAILFYSAGATATGFINGHRSSVGFTTGASESYSVGVYSENGAATSVTSRRMAAKVLTTPNDDGSGVTYEGDLTSFDADGFTLNWTTNDGTARIINYIAIGGADVTNVKAVNWTYPLTATTKAVTGVGFQPTLVLHATIDSTAALGTSTTHGRLTFGAMDSSGNQWTNDFAMDDALADSNTARSQRTDACIASAKSDLSGFWNVAAFASMDSDGFTTNFSTAAGTANQAISLCIKTSSNGRAKVGSFTKDTGASPDAQSVTGVGFTPKGVLFSSWGRAASASPQAHAHWSFGAFSAAGSEKGIAIRDEDAQATSDAQGYQNDFAVTQLDESTASTVDAQFDFTSLDADGFSGSWATNDADADQVLYLALGGATGAGLDKVLVAHNDTTELDIMAIDSTLLDTGTWTTIEGVSTTDPLSGVAFATGLGQVLYSHKKWSTIRRWDGTTAASIAGSPPARALAFHKNRFFAGGTEANPTRLWYSDLASYSTWGATSYIDVGADDGEAIEDVAYFEDGLVIAKRNSLWFLSGSGPDTFTVHRLNAGGGYAGRCIVATPYGAIIAGTRQVWLWTGGGVELVSKPIEESYSLAGDFVTTTYLDGEAYICDEDTGTIFVLDMQRGVWRIETVASASTEGPAVIAAKADKIYYGPQAATTYSLIAYREMPGGTRARDASLAETFTAYTPEIWPVGPDEEFTPAHLFIKWRQRAGASGTAISIVPVIDGETKTTLTIAAKAQAGTYRTALRVTSEVKGAQSIQFRISHPLTNSDTNVVDLEEMVMTYLREGRRVDG